MKKLSTIVISLLLVLMILPVVPVKSQNTKKFVLRTNEKNIAITTLKRCSDIISSRLKLYGITQFDVRVSEDNHQIELQLPGNSDFKSIEGFLTSRGDISFYETYDQGQISTMIRTDDKLFSLVSKESASKSSDPRVGCAETGKAADAEKYITTMAPVKNCMLLWGKETASGKCLFALKVTDSGTPLISREDIESATVKKGADMNDIRLQLKLKPAMKSVFAEATRNNLNKSIAIVIDGRVFSWPVVRSVIEKGEIEVTGSFTEGEVNYLPVIFNTEKLPVTLVLVK